MYIIKVNLRNAHHNTEAFKIIELLFREASMSSIYGFLTK